MQIKSRAMSDEEIGTLCRLLASPKNDTGGSKLPQIIHISQFSEPVDDGPPNSVVVTLNFDDEHGIDKEYLKEVLTLVGALHAIRFTDEPTNPAVETRARLVGEGARAVLSDGTTYELEIDSSVRWGINVKDMPSPRFRILLETLEFPAIGGDEPVPYAIITRMEVGEFKMPLRFSFNLNVRHCHASHDADDVHDHVLREGLCRALGITLEFAKDQVRV